MVFSLVSIFYKGRVWIAATKNIQMEIRKAALYNRIMNNYQILNFRTPFGRKSHFANFEKEWRSKNEVQINRRQCKVKSGGCVSKCASGRVNRVKNNAGLGNVREVGTRTCGFGKRQIIGCCSSHCLSSSSVSSVKNRIGLFCLEVCKRL